MTTEKVAVFLFGVFFIIIMLIVAIAIPSPTELQWRVFNLVLALSAGAVTAFLPGVFHLRFTPWLRAGGSLAVFAMVYLVKPAALVASNPFDPLPKAPPIERAAEVIRGQLQLIDKGRYAEAFAASYPGWKDTYKQDDFVRLGQTIRAPLGSVESRMEAGQYGQEDRVQRLHVHSFLYLTKFSNMNAPIKEMVGVVARDEKSGWMAAGYQVDVQGAQMVGIPTPNKAGQGTSR